MISKHGANGEHGEEDPRAGLISAHWVLVLADVVALIVPRAPASLASLAYYCGLLDDARPQRQADKADKRG